VGVRGAGIPAANRSSAARDGRFTTSSAINRTHYFGLFLQDPDGQIDGQSKKENN
jgi:hypothetical protein